MKFKSPFIGCWQLITRKNFLALSTLLSIAHWWCFSSTHVIGNEWTSGYLLQHPYWPFFFLHLQVQWWQWWLLDWLSAHAQTWCGRGFAGSCWKMFRSVVWRVCLLDWYRLSGGKMVRASVMRFESVSSLSSVSFFCLPLMTGVSCRLF